MSYCGKYGVKVSHLLYTGGISSQNNGDTKTGKGDEKMRNELLVKAIDKAIIEICKLHNKEDMEWHFEHEQQNSILERIAFFIDNEYWVEMRGF